jgi:glucose-1-phosphate adenylyltransferase
MDNDNKISAVDINTGKQSENNISMEMYIMSKSLFLDIIHTCSSKGDCDYLKDAIHRNIGKFNVYGYEHKGYLACVNSIQSYFKTSMQLLDMKISRDLFFKNGLIYTKVKDEAPTKYTENAVVTNSLLANGSMIDGTVENSIVFRGVRVRKGAVVKNCILMQNSVVEEGAFLRNVILDKNVIITQDKQLKGDDNYPIVIEKKAII